MSTIDPILSFHSFVIEDSTAPTKRYIIVGKCFVNPIKIATLLNILVFQQVVFSLSACGEGFCHECSDYKRPVPERGWGPEEAVRVCRDCYGPLSTKASQSRGRGLSAPTKAPSPVASQPKEDSINARRYGEKVISVSATLFGAVLDYPLNALKDSARPTYWVPDEVRLLFTRMPASRAS